MTSRRRDAHLAPALVAATALAVVLSGCTGGESSGTVVTAATPTGPVLQPGRPGEPNATLTGSAAAPVTTPVLRPADSRFLREMIVHHAQAIVMVDAVMADLTDAQVRSLASRMRDEQAPEIDAMAGYLEGFGEDVPPEATNHALSDHGSHSMPGMATPAEIQRLAAATGSQADQLFLTLMVRHHQGALSMVDEHSRNASEERVEEMAAEVNVTQTKQIGLMREMLDRLG